MTAAGVAPPAGGAEEPRLPIQANWAGCGPLWQWLFSALAREPIAPTDHNICTWKATDGHSWVTLTLQTLGAFDSGKKLASVAKSVVLTPVIGLDDRAYYLAVNDRVGLVVKKSGSAFNVAAYQRGPLNSRQTTERTLAEKIMPRLSGAQVRTHER